MTYIIERRPYEASSAPKAVDVFVEETWIDGYSRGTVDPQTGRFSVYDRLGKLACKATVKPSR